MISLVEYMQIQNIQILEGKEGKCVSILLFYYIQRLKSLLTKLTQHYHNYSAIPRAELYPYLTLAIQFIQELDEFQRQLIIPL
jgi:hypothetical protein